jgi:hypothetical protein
MFLRVRRPRTTAQRLAAEIDRVVRVLVADRAHAVATFDAWRSKDVLLEALATSYRDEPASTLLDLDVEQIAAVEAFFREHARFATWARTTDVMPATLDARYEAALTILVVLGAEAVALLGGVPEDEAPPAAPSSWGTLRR